MTDDAKGPQHRWFPRWTWPVVALLALLVMLAAWVPDAPDPQLPDDPMEWSFLGANTTMQSPRVSLLAYWPENVTRPDAVEAVADAQVIPLKVDWQTGRLGFVNHTLCCPVRIGDHQTDAAAAGPRFGLDGHNATVVTVHLWTADEVILGSNAPVTDLARFPISDDFVQLPGDAWYLGQQETAPNGTRKLPSEFRELGDLARELLEGLPPGGVASGVLREEQYRFGWLLGDLWLSARIESLVQAP